MAPSDPTSPRRLVEQFPLSWLRVAQFTMDLAAVAVLCLVPLALQWILPRNPDGTLRPLMLAIPMMLGILAACATLSWCYLAWWPSRHQGQTPAMRWLGVRVVGADGRAATLTQLGLRWVMLLVDGMGFGLVGVATMLATRGERRLGDILADTRVVRAGEAEPAAR